MKAAIVATLLVLLATPRARPGDLEIVLDLEKRFAAVVERVRPTVVSISAAYSPATPGASPEKAPSPRLEPVLPPPPTPRSPWRRPRRGFGSGVIISADGLVLTNHHVAGEATSVSVTLSDGARRRAVVVGTDPHGDLALLKIDAKDLPYATLGPDDRPTTGSWVIAVGNPFTLAMYDGAPIVTQGIVSGLHRIQPGTRDGSLFYGDAIQTDAEINPGNSGGPLFDLAGRLVGINGRIATRRRLYRINTGVAFAVSARQIRRVLPNLKAGGTVRHGFLGVRYDVDERNGAGVEIRYVYPGSPAAVADLVAGDRIIAVDGSPVRSGSRLVGVLSTLPEGARTRLRVTHDGTERTVRVVLARRPGSLAR